MAWTDAARAAAAATRRAHGTHRIKKPPRFSIPVAPRDLARVKKNTYHPTTATHKGFKR